MITGMHSENTDGSFSSGSATTIALGKQYSVFLDSLSVLRLFFFLLVRYWNTFFTYEAELACEILGAF